jgi:hypothetical protein
MTVFGIQSVVGVDVRNLISSRGPQGKQTKGARVVGMDYVQTGNYLERSMIVRYSYPHPRVKEESE